MKRNDTASIKDLKAIDPPQSKGEKLTAETQMLRAKKIKFQMVQEAWSFIKY